MRLCLVLVFLIASAYGQCSNCSETLQTFRTSIKLEFPYYSTPNSPGLGEPNPKVNYAAFSFHGIDRDANNYYCYLETSIELSLSSQLKQEQFILIAPYFMELQDQPPPNFIFWDDDSWKQAGNSSKYLPQSLSSFTVIDEMLATLVNKTIYPNMKAIFLIGHSAGGQTVHRFTIGTSFEDTAKANNITITYAAANPSSYAYFDPRRPSNLPAPTCATYCNASLIPSMQFQYAVPNVNATNCTAYNVWPYGMENLYPYMQQSVPMMLNRYAARDMTYFLGGLDICNAQFNCGCSDTDMDETCSGDAQGWCRQQRGFGYYNYLQQLNLPKFNHQIHIVPNVGHDGCGMITSETLRAQLWGPLGGQVPLIELSNSHNNNNDEEKTGEEFLHSLGKNRSDDL